jgi:hypothetical protein
MYILTYDYVDIIRYETVHFVMFIVEFVFRCTVVSVVKCVLDDGLCSWHTT